MGYRIMGWLLAVALLASLGALAPNMANAQKKTPGVWTDLQDPTLPEDFKIQGEYMGTKIGCQVIALGKGTFQAVVYPGGLPGETWDGKNKILMDGKLADGKATFTPATG